jgi:hypothetical protein
VRSAESPQAIALGPLVIGSRCDVSGRRIDDAICLLDDGWRSAITLWYSQRVSAADISRCQAEDQVHATVRSRAIKPTRERADPVRREQLPSVICWRRGFATCVGPRDTL